MHILAQMLLCLLNSPTCRASKVLNGLGLLRFIRAQRTYLDINPVAYLHELTACAHDNRVLLLVGILLCV